MTAIPDTGVDMLLDVGGAPEAVLSAAALKYALGGDIQCRLWPRDDAEHTAAERRGLDLRRVFEHRTSWRAATPYFFSLTGITDGELVKGVRYFPRGASTETLVMRSRSGTVHRIHAVHNF